MKQHRLRKCRHCSELFRPDPRNLHHQRYCGKRECRKVSKAASQHRWLAKAQNRNYFHGAANVERVRAWGAAEPGYRRRSGTRSTTALQIERVQGVSDVIPLTDRLRPHRAASGSAQFRYLTCSGSTGVSLISMIALRPSVQ